MRDRNPWLITDERMGDAILAALRRLPPGSGVVFRHRETPRKERLALWLAVRRIATVRRLHAVAVGNLPGAQGRHSGRRPTTASAHNRREAIMARGATYLFVSPVFATRSHVGKLGIGAMKAAAIGKVARAGRRSHPHIIALGGMDARRYRRIAHLGFVGWAAIDALTRQG